MEEMVGGEFWLVEKVSGEMSIGHAISLEGGAGFDLMYCFSAADAKKLKSRFEGMGTELRRGLTETFGESLQRGNLRETCEGWGIGCTVRRVATPARTAPKESGERRRR